MNIDEMTADEMELATLRAQSKHFAHLLCQSIVVAARHDPEIVRKALASCFDLEAIEEMNCRIEEKQAALLRMEQENGITLRALADRLATAEKAIEEFRDNFRKIREAWPLRNGKK